MLSLRVQPTRGAAPAQARPTVAPQVHRPAAACAAAAPSVAARTAVAAAAGPSSSSAAAEALYQPRRQRVAVVASAASTQEAPQAEAEAEASTAPPAATADGAAAPTATKRKRPFWRNNWKKKSTLEKGWWAAPEYSTVAALYEELLRRCELQDVAVAPLFRIFKLASSPEEARVALNAVAAVRTAAMRKGDVERFSDQLAAAFVVMIKAADAPDVLAEALGRATELGLVCSSSCVNRLLKQWGGQGELAKIEEVLAAMPLGGMEYNTQTAYIIIRASVGAGQLDKAEYYAQAMREREVRLSATAERLLEAARNGTAKVQSEPAQE